MPVRINPLFRPLTKPKRFKVMYGGRGGGKSWAAGLVLVNHSNKQRIKVVCARAFQNSIAESSKELIEQCIRLLGLEHRFKITDKEIINLVTRSRFIFIGIERNPGAVKSLEGCDICWVEEANQVGRKALDMLIPTIRKPGSEIWFTFNPELDTDPIYADFVTNTPENCVLIKINYTDNPDCPEVLQEEAARCLALSPSRYRHIWLGEPGWPDDAMYIPENFPVVADPEFEAVFITVDGAMKSNPDNDGTGLCIWGATRDRRDQRKLVLLDWMKVKIDGHILNNMVAPMIQRAKDIAIAQEIKTHRKCTYMGCWIEDKASGPIIIGQLRDGGDKQVFPLDSRFWVSRSKAARATGAGAYIDSRQVLISKYAAEKTMMFNSSNENHFFRELKNFRVAIREQEDDLIDCMNYAIILAFDLGDTP